ncbi:hypothetical protein GCM10010277_58830 [Streptomyces longisporoflavus]|uniref:hypothetical protein n=1 Tax=Streptomyces longisporoflavus TaxID=28044 RepID=UPI00167EC890|nr:hypothetical protein [Streptomyces longisporoflavus]GGV57138.1 hypothetical protein GCM10010277_58830 [Streptomyces longisporoflavus]
MAESVSRTILLFDIEQFGTRDDVEQAFLRRMLYDVADGTLAAADVSETARLRADRGDSVVELIDANVPVSGLLKALLTETPMLLNSKNRLMAGSTRMRLRIVLAAGYVAVDEKGWIGGDLNHAFRLLDAEPLREALRTAADSSVLCVSDTLYQGVVRHGHHGVRPEEFHKVAVETKEGPSTAWLHQVVAPERGGSGGSRPTGSSPTGSPSTSPSATSTQIMGSQYGITGGHVAGDVNFDLRGGERGDRK